MRKAVAATAAAGETILIAASVTLQRFPSLPHEIKNHCTLEGINRQNPASILKSGPEIKDHGTLEDVSRQKHASIRKSELEIKNRCTQEGINGENLVLS